MLFEIEFDKISYTLIKLKFLRLNGFLLSGKAGKKDQATKARKHKITRRSCLREDVYVVYMVYVVHVVSDGCMRVFHNVLQNIIIPESSPLSVLERGRHHL
jgi:hypothetical protein